MLYHIVYKIHIVLVLHKKATGALQRQETLYLAKCIKFFLRVYLERNCCIFNTAILPQAPVQQQMRSFQKVTMEYRWSLKQGS